MERGNTSTSSLFGRMSARASFISKKELKVTIQLLNDSETINTEFKKSATGKDVLDYVCEFMNIHERDYFGLRYQDHNRYRYWVDLTQPLSSVAKLFKSDNIAFRLRFRFYPVSASQLREEITRYQLNVQLQRDLLHGRLYSPQPVAAQLAAYILQSQLGDYDETTADGAKYVSEYKLLLKQTPKVEEKIAELHKGLRGMSAGEAELKMIELASQMETYGFDPYTVKAYGSSANQNQVYIGATHRGILIFSGSQKEHHIQWNEVTKLDYSGDKLCIYPCEGYEPLVDLDQNATTMNGHNQTLTNESMIANGMPDDKENDMSHHATDKEKVSKDKALRYLCPSRTFAKHLWLHLLSQKAFFNVSKSEEVKPVFSKPRIPLLTRGSTFRFPSAQRVLAEIETSPIEERPPVTFERYELPKQPPRPDLPTMTKYQTLPSNMKLANGHVSNGSLRRSTSNGEDEKEKIGVEKVAEKIKVPDLEMNLLDSSPSSSVAPSPAAPSVSTTTTVTSSATNGQNVSVFTVRMVKMETSATVTFGGDESPAPTTASTVIGGTPIDSGDDDVIVERNNNNERKMEEIMAHLNGTPSGLGEPLAHSTPIIGSTVANGKKLSTGNGAAIKTTNGSTTTINGGSQTKQVEEKTSSSSSTTSSIGRKAVSGVMFLSLVLLILVALLIVLFERQESSAFVEQHPWLIDLRSQYYQPSREFVMSKYVKAFNH